MRPPLRSLLALTAALPCACPLPAQQFRPLTAAPIPASIGTIGQLDMAAGDLDGDGFADVVVALDYDGVVELLSDRHGGFVDVTTPVLKPSYASAYGVALGDVDGDGDLDLAIAHDHAATVQICLNNGAGVFTDATAIWSPPLPSAAYAVAWLDADGDGALDLYVAAGSSGRLLRQSGGRLVDVTATSLPSGRWSTMGIHVAGVDLDADGDSDLALKSPSTIVSAPLLWNDGSGRFTAPVAGALPASFPRLLAYGDFDGDLLVDLFVRAIGGTQLWLQRRGGTFVDATATSLPSLTAYWDAVAADVDSDGDLDICGQDRLLINDGVGRFTDETATRWTVTQGTAGFGGGPAFVMADVDGDRDLDFVVADTLSSQLVSINHHRQVSARIPPVLGGPYVLDFSLRPGYGAGNPLVVAWFASAPLNQPTPFGRLGVDPATVVPVRPMLVPGTTDRWRYPLIIPNLGSLAGVTFYVQGASVPAYPGVAGLWNTLREQIR
ncbi:MAG: VCBS repeat-containing protein [Planctomycetes bacterium]|nr:VCBS repeat-containing protein [Planctomycetota bacterium]